MIMLQKGVVLGIVFILSNMLSAQVQDCERVRSIVKNAADSTLHPHIRPASGLTIIPKVVQDDEIVIFQDSIDETFLTLVIKVARYPVYNLTYVSEYVYHPNLKDSFNVRYYKYGDCRIYNSYFVREFMLNEIELIDSIKIYLNQDRYTIDTCDVKKVISPNLYKIDPQYLRPPELYLTEDMSYLYLYVWSQIEYQTDVYKFIFDLKALRYLGVVSASYNTLHYDLSSDKWHTNKFCYF